ncbi:MAG: hypothetical protein ABW000_03790 [Actinoplanes sp.]
MSQDPTEGDWQDWTATPQPWSQPAGTDPSDPLVSNDYNGWWQRSFGLIKAGWKRLAAVQLGVAIPSAAVLAPATITYRRQQNDAQQAFQDSVDAGGSPDFGALFAGWQALLVASAIAAVLSMLGLLITAQLVVFTATGRHQETGAAVRAALRRAPALLGWGLLAVPLFVLSVILCFFPALYVGAALAVLPVVVLLERGKGIGRSFNLFHANLGVSLSRLATAAGLSFAGSLVVNLLTTLANVILGDGLTTTNPVAVGLTVTLQAIYSCVAGVVLTTMLVTAYADMRAHREHFTTADLTAA